jgi:hypothetical protein
MTEPELQGQHRISQIYLKQFGFKRDDKWYISVWRKFTDHTDIELIETFSKEVNIFDLPFADFKHRRHFENSSNLIEREYSKIINTLANQHQLIPRHKDILRHYVANLVCRTKPYRNFFGLLLKSEQARDKFLNEITMFKEETLPELQKLLDILKQEFQLNVAIGTLMNHLVRVFRAFSFVVLKDYDNRGWFTSDNPVILDKQNNHSWIIPIETEIYFPLSKDFCLFMFNKHSEIQKNHLRKYQINKVAPSDEATYKNISDRILHNNNDFLIFPVEIDKTYFTLDENNGT